MAVSSSALVAGAPRNDVTAEDSGSVFISTLSEEECDSVAASSKTSSPSALKLSQVGWKKNRDGNEGAITLNETPSLAPPSSYPTYIENEDEEPTTKTITTTEEPSYTPTSPYPTYVPTGDR